MIKKSAIALAIITAAASTLGLTNITAQSAIKVEAANGKETPGTNGPIQIQMPKKTNSNVSLTTASRASHDNGAPVEIKLPKSDQPEVDKSKVKVTEPTDGQADNTPADGEIDLTPAQFKPRQPKTTPVPIILAPSPTPIPTPAPTPMATPKSVTEVKEEATKSPEANPSKEAADNTGYLPPANLGKDKTVERGGETLPLRPEQLTSAPLEITIPDVYQTTLTNGIHFYHYENHDLPRIRVAMIIDAGQNADPADKVGLADITAKTMRSGGAAGKSGDEIDQNLEQIGSDLEFNVDRDHVSGSLFALSSKADEAMKLLSDVVVKPEFDEKKFEQEKARAMEVLRRQNDSPDEISRREFRKIIYGPDYPLARTPTSSTIAGITRDHVRKFHDARYRPSTLYIGISGDISQDNARKLVETAFASWKRPEADKIEMPAVNDNASSGGVYLTKKATAQAQIRMGHLGIPRRSPKAYAVNVLNSIYGTGGFSSRLMNEVRTKNGYVYGVGGGIMSDDPVGLYVAAAASKSATTAAAIKEILNVTKGIIDGPISDLEVDTARRDIIFTFVNQFDTPAETVKAHMLYDFRGYAPDYLKTFPERIREVTGQDVKAVAKEFLKPENIKIYVIGNPEDFDAKLDQFGAMHDWDLEDYSGK